MEQQLQAKLDVERSAVLQEHQANVRAMEETESSLEVGLAKLKSKELEVQRAREGLHQREKELQLRLESIAGREARLEQALARRRELVRKVQGEVAVSYRVPVAMPAPSIREDINSKAASSNKQGANGLALVRSPSPHADDTHHGRAMGDLDPVAEGRRRLEVLARSRVP